jgi:pSer/pThr/pTyr-binding forkhead associated (FHA) protein
MHLGQVSKPLVVEEKPEIMIGRRDEDSGNLPDIDLTPYGALDEGVSRVHARLQQSEDALTLIDLNSVNGTYLNGERLIPNQPRILHDGDEIRFGKLITRVYFRAASST